MTARCIVVDGCDITPRMWSLIQDAARAAKVPVPKVMQGSFNAGGVKASAGTHDGGGAVDLSIKALSGSQQVALVTQLRRRNGCAWLRTPAYGWPASAGGPHLHMIVRDEAGLSSGARAQVYAYDQVRNGLANKGRDTLPRPAQYPMEVLHPVTTPSIKHSGKVGSASPMYKTPVDAPVAVPGGKWFTAAIVDITAAGKYIVSFQVRMPKSVGAAEAQIVRLGWPGLAKEDSTGHNPVAPATLHGGAWYRWRTPIEHPIDGGGKIAYSILLPAGTHSMRFVCKATKVS